jgi:tight adherence protein B
MEDAQFMMVMTLVGSLMILGLIYAAVTTADPSAKALSRRLERIQDMYATSASAIAEARIRRVMARQDTKLDSFFKQIMPRKDLLMKRLKSTGKSWTVSQYVLAMAGTLVVITLLMTFVVNLPLALSILMGLAAGVGLPHMVVGVLIKKRVGAFIKMFPDAIDLLVRGLRSGLPISESIGVVGKELPDPIGVEFRLVADKIKIGKTMDVALAEMAERTPAPEIQFFVISLAIQRETGGNLAETLGNLSDILRKRMQMKLKIKALSSEAKASAYILGVLPFLIFLIISSMNPEYTAGFFSDVRLMIAAGGGLIWMSIGAFIMMRMINFEI